jgi:hexosaminidase
VAVALRLCPDGGVRHVAEPMHATQRIARLPLFVIAFAISSAAAARAAAQSVESAIVPRPAVIEMGKGEFTLSADAGLFCDAADDVKAVAAYLAEEIGAAIGAKLEARGGAPPKDAKAAIQLTTEGADAKLGDEGYELTIAPTLVTLRSKTARGLFVGVQTIRQLLPPAVAAASAPAAARSATLPALKITDQPRYRWRGMLLDCGRHFMPKEFVKRYIDLLAYYKLNVLHLHLTDDQGWRIEIKKYPKLTEIGAWRPGTRESEQPRDAQGRYGGFYTQDDIRELVAYAKSRYITIVPEIELPGHARAALAAYPEYSCTGGPFKVRTEWGVEEDVYCAGSDKTFEFLEGVLSEVLELFPSEFIHIGGDECPKSRWKNCPRCQQRMKSESLKDEHELQSYFIRRVEKILNEKGRRLIGWDEILEGGLAPNATVQSWRGMEGALAATTSGHDVISSPTSHCYLDYAQGPGIDEPRFMGFVPLERCYQFEPTPDSLTAEQAVHVLGLEGNVWTEHAPPALIDRQTFPRLIALAEVGWTPKERRDWMSFQRRLNLHYPRLDALGVRFYVPPPSFAITSAASASAAGGFELSTLTPASGVVAITDKPYKLIMQSLFGGEIRFTINGDIPTTAAMKYAAATEIADTTLVRARAFLPTGNVSPTSELRFVKVAPRAAVELKSPEPGVKVDAYKGTWKQLPEFAKLTPTTSATLPGNDKDPLIRETAVADLSDQFGLRFTGFFNAPAEGLYVFRLRSDDGSRLRLGDDVIVDNDGEHPPRDVVGYAWLKPGYHPLTVEYFQGIGGKKLEAFVEGPGLAAGPLTGATVFVEK